MHLAVKISSEFLLFPIGEKFLKRTVKLRTSVYTPDAED